VTAVHDSRLAVVKTRLSKIQRLRAQFLQEANCQIRYNAAHERGWTDSYLLTIDGVEIGYGSIKGSEQANRDTLFEMYVLPPFRTYASDLCKLLLVESKATDIECQTNDRLLSSLLFEQAHDINSDTILFEAGTPSALQVPGGIVRERRLRERIFEHHDEPVGDFVLEVDRDVVATAGFLLHYNEPFADLYMEVREDCRRKGFGSFIVQEVITRCYIAGRVPAARTSVHNVASRKTLIKAGLRIAGFVARGSVSVPPVTDLDGKPAAAASPPRSIRR
jgi:GNAT superfamily N-acetyltransferase